MLKDKDSAAIVAVADMKRATEFYGTVLGLDYVSGDDDVAEFRTGRTTLVVYRSDFAGTNKANAVVWGVGDEIDAIVSSLMGKGVRFERYDGMDFADGIHSAGDFKMAWFKDPDGNILHLNNM
ncbi:Glyoxalase/Bleomycin resistance protein/Dioxygenase superfamily protein [Devosia lucknowensis]|uniref:Glyoxalase/Bleomycin resistance protein/Dioxygenase superfamily protein n=1 Tax=Devosia lucknowensis TaxID=1096929 RepID=A0A1Y6FE49_9HYPH|nr:VOC family protein [Devosia lucknowensis]SMQ73057.1 Glyoxalase/Bleomycin resistance protein/Dioxygenase superfamily protein [Devosia lucknowensis]